MAEPAKTSQAAPIKLSVEDKLGLVVRLLAHQGTINYAGFDSGTGQSIAAVKSMMERLKKQFVSDAAATGPSTDAAKPGKDGTCPKKGETKDAIEPAEKKKRSPPKKAKAEDEDEEEEEDLEALAAAGASGLYAP